VLLDLLSHHHRVVVFTDFPQPYGNPKEASLPQKQTKPANTAVQPSSVRVTVADPIIRAAVEIPLAKTLVVVCEASITASSSSKIKLPSTALTPKTSTILATGRHDLSDEELITLFLELID
jgi:hypothetical protein